MKIKIEKKINEKSKLLELTMSTENGRLVDHIESRSLTRTTTEAFDGIFTKNVQPARIFFHYGEYCETFALQPIHAAMSLEDIAAELRRRKKIVCEWVEKKENELKSQVASLEFIL